MAKKKLKKKPKKTEEKIRKIKIKVIGIGGGGNSIIGDISSRMKGVKFVAANTDSAALKRVGKKVRTFQFGENLTGGMGTGMDFELGKEAAQKAKKRIKRLLKGQDFCIFVSCLGGGTGSGATPVFAKTSKDLGNLNFGIFTLPFKFEGQRKAEIARDALRKLRPYLQAFSIIPNERIFKIVDKKTPLKTALSTINERLTESLEGLIEMIKKPGFINIDFADLQTILSQRNRVAFLNRIEFKRGAQKEIEKLIFSPLYPYDIKGARGLLFNIEGANKLGLGEVNEIARGLQKLVGRKAKIIFGITQKRGLGDKIGLTLLATGCRMKGEILPKITKKPKRKRVKKKIKKVKVKVKALAKVKKVKPLPVKAPEEKRKEKEKQRIRRNALQIKSELEEKEKERLEKEEVWEIPALLRRKKKKV